MKKLLLALLPILLFSCGGDRDIVNNLQGRYIAIDQKDRELYYGITINNRSSFTLWYMASDGTIKEESYNLDNLEVINQYRYFYSTDSAPTWVYIYNSSSAPFNLRILEYTTGDLELRLQFKPEQPIHDRDLDHRDIKLIGRDSLDSFKYYTKLKPYTGSLPELINIKDSIAYQNRDITELYNTIYTCRGTITDQYLKKRTNYYFNNGVTTWEEYITVEIEGSNPPLYIEFLTSEQLTNDLPFTYDLNSTLEKNIKIRSFKYLNNDKTIILLKGEINTGSYIHDINIERE